MAVTRRGFDGGTVFDILNYTGFALFAVVMIYPFWELLVVSLMPALEATELGVKLWPKKIVFGAYQAIFRSKAVGYGYLNTIYRTVFGTTLSVFLTFCTAYPLANRKLPARTALTVFYLIPMFFSGGLIPSYLLVRSLGLLDSRWALIIPGLLATFNILIMRNFIMTIPDSLEESAMIDGASFFRILVQIIIPLSVPILATIALWVAVYHWNAWFDALIYIRSHTKQVLQMLLRRIIIQDEMMALDLQMDEVTGQADITPRSVEAGTVIVTIGPIILIYPFVQRYFVKGIMIGSLKG